MNQAASHEVNQNLSGLENLEANPLYEAFKLALGTIGLKDWEEAQKIANLARESVQRHAATETTTVGLVSAASSLLNHEEMAALRRFYECALDGEGYDVSDAMMRRLAEIGVVRRRSGSYYLMTDFGDAVLSDTVQAAIAESAIGPLQSSGWLYINDDGHGPFYTHRKDYAGRYLHNWEVYKRAPADGHVCNYNGGYGVCTLCEALKDAPGAARAQALSSDPVETQAANQLELQAIGQAVDRARGELPDCFTVHIDLTRGTGSVRLYNGLVDDETGDFPADTLAEQVNAAVDSAIRKAKPGAD